MPFPDNASVMALRELPKHLIVLGGGYIGCEFAQMFRRFGSQVTVVEALDRLLSIEDPETSAALQGVFEAEGIGLAMVRAPLSLKKLVYLDGQKAVLYHRTHFYGFYASQVRVSSPP